jgi:hypothetical protein
VGIGAETKDPIGGMASTGTGSITHSGSSARAAVVETTARNTVKSTVEEMRTIIPDGNFIP